MSGLDFPTWFGAGSYGGLACGLLSAAGVAGYALRRHRGTPRQLARSILVCLGASCLMLASIWWNQNRLDLYGPSLDPGEVLLWLSASALFGWLVPLGTLAGYVLLAGPQAIGLPLMGEWRGHGNAGIAALDDPARRIEPLGEGTPWGRLVPVEGEFAGQTLALTRQLTLLGREYNNDIVIDDERTSRYHAELHWDHGHVEIVDRGSMNGTLVNRQAVRGRIPLKSGDVLDLGAQRYRLEILASVAAVDAELAPPDADEETRKMPGAASDAATGERDVLPLALAGARQLGTGGRWDLTQAVATIGRDSERTICLPHESVSRLHAQIVRQRTGYFVSDLGSRNGTYLNGQRLTAPSLLMPGDVLRVGEIELRCEAASPSALGIPAAVPADMVGVSIAVAARTPIPIPTIPGSNSHPSQDPAADATLATTPSLMEPARAPAPPAATRLGPPRLTGSLPAGEQESAP